jgi:outer membrane lipoprotein-sorting protein
MKFDSRRVWLSLNRGFTLTAVVYFLLHIVEVFVGEPTTPLLERLPLAWVWYWPKLFFSRSANTTDRDLFFALVVNIIVYTIAFYGISLLADGRTTNKKIRSAGKNLCATISLLILAAGSQSVMGEQRVPLTPEAILRKTADRYASCSSYQDIGIVTVTYDIASGRRIDEQPFKLFFARPQRLRAEWIDAYLPIPKLNVLWSNGNGTFFYREPNRFEKEASLANGIVAVAGISHGAGYTIPRLLTPEMDTTALTDLKNLTLVGEELFEHELCYRLRGLDSGEDVNELWISKGDFLLRKKTTHTAFEDFSTVAEEIHRDIKVNRPISNEIFDFKPPIPLNNPTDAKEGGILYAPPASHLWFRKLSFAKWPLLWVLGGVIMAAIMALFKKYFD